MDPLVQRSGQGEAPPEYLVVGEIVAPFGIRGEVKVLLDTDFPDLVLQAKVLWIGDPPVRYAVEAARPHQQMAVLKVAGCDDRNAAEALRGELVQVPAADVPAPAEGEYFYYQLIGLEVWTEEGELLGRVQDIASTGNNEVLLVKGPRGEVLLPVIEAVVRQVDLPSGRILVHLLEGLRS